MCRRCEAARYLTAEDCEAVRFFERVGDQVVPLTPFGCKPEDGGLNLAPRLGAWEAALRLYGYPVESWTRLVDLARLLHEAVHGRTKVSGLFAMDPQDLAPPGEDEDER